MIQVYVQVYVQVLENRFCTPLCFRYLSRTVFRSKTVLQPSQTGNFRPSAVSMRNFRMQNDHIPFPSHAFDGAFSEIRERRTCVVWTADENIFKYLDMHSYIILVIISGVEI